MTQQVPPTPTTVAAPAPTREPLPVLFVLGCVPVRLLLAYLVAGGHAERVRVPAAVAATAVGLGFLVVHAAGLRKSGPETFGRPIWWDHLRPMHGALHLAVAVLVAVGHDRAAAAILFGDVMMGVGGWVQHRYCDGHTVPGEKN
jgi:hypothetical protein